MARVVPWQRLEALIEPHYSVAGRGRRPYPLGVMLRVHFLQHWFGYSDPAMEEALHDIPVLRRFAGLDAHARLHPAGFRARRGGQFDWSDEHVELGGSAASCRPSRSRISG